MWFTPENEPVFTKTLELDVSKSSQPRPQASAGRVALPQVDELFNSTLKVYKKSAPQRTGVEGKDHDIGDGDVVIAAITSCTNTSNPDVLIAAGLVARRHARKASPPSARSRPASHRVRRS